MARPTSKFPTELELQVLNVLWDQGPKSGRDIRDELASNRELTYQSVMTILGIMEEKKYVTRKKSGSRFLYRAVVTQKATSKKMMRDLVNRIFGGSTHAAMIGLLEGANLDEAELTELKSEINRRAKEKKS